MKIKVDITFSAVVVIPKLIVDNTPGGADTVLKEVKDRLTAEMAIKHGKDVKVEANVLEEKDEL